MRFLYRRAPACLFWVFPNCLSAVRLTVKQNSETNRNFVSQRPLTRNILVLTAFRFCSIEGGVSKNLSVFRVRNRFTAHMLFYVVTASVTRHMIHPRDFHLLIFYPVAVRVYIGLTRAPEAVWQVAAAIPIQNLVGRRHTNQK